MLLPLAKIGGIAGKYFGKIMPIGRYFR